MKDTKKTVGFVGIREAAELSGLPQHFWRFILIMSVLWLNCEVMRCE